jgi:2-polyprenyl-3-methyl-5-hydroxy-6-metoxy-1,4-benzoquinol methylase
MVQTYPQKKCLICSAEQKFFSRKKNFYYVRCPKCGLISLGNPSQNIESLYKEGYFTGDVSYDGYMDYDLEKEASYSTVKHELDYIERALTKKGSLFEIGCATGFFLKRAQERGWVVCGADISEYAVEEAKKKGLEAWVLNFESGVIPEKKFNVVLMLDVVEHLLDTKKSFSFVHKLLYDDGLFVFATPDSGSIWAKIWGSKWHALVPPQHINIYSLDNVSKILSESGFVVLKYTHMGKTFSLPYIFRLLKTWTGISFFGFLSALCLQNRFLKSIKIPINVGDTMFVIARKK